MKKILGILLLTVGVYWLWSRKKEASAAEVSDIDNQIKQESIPPAAQLIPEVITQPEKIEITPAQICKNVIFSPPPRLLTLIYIGPRLLETRQEVICGEDLVEIQEKAEQRRKELGAMSGYVV